MLYNPNLPASGGEIGADFRNRSLNLSAMYAYTGTRTVQADSGSNSESRRRSPRLLPAGWDRTHDRNRPLVTVKSRAKLESIVT